MISKMMAATRESQEYSRPDTNKSVDNFNKNVDGPMMDMKEYTNERGMKDNKVM